MDHWVTQLFRSVDDMDSDRFATFLTDDANFKFGNADVVAGREQVRKAVADFFGSIKALHHDVVNVWEVPGTVVTELRVTYTRKDGKKVSVPCVNLFGMEGTKIRDYKIFIDIAPVYAQ